MKKKLETRLEALKEKLSSQHSLFAGKAIKAIAKAEAIQEEIAFLEGVLSEEEPKEETKKKEEKKQSKK